jgi:SAM-dependent methyltransferase
MSDVLEHIPEPEMIISEIYRVLKLNGKLLLNVPFYYCIHEAPHDFYRFTEFALRYLLEKVGFKIIKLEFIGGPVEVIADVIIKNTAHISLLGNPLAIFLQWITLLYTKTKIGKKINRAAAHKFPLGYFVVAEKA